MNPTHEQIAMKAFELWARWIEMSKWSPGALDPGPEHFWFEAERELAQEEA